MQSSLERFVTKIEQNNIIEGLSKLQNNISYSVLRKPLNEMHKHKKQANDSSVKPLEDPTEENSFHFKVVLVPSIEGC